MITTTFPLSEEIFFKLDEIDQSNYVVDVSKIDFGEDEDNIESAIIYARNLQITMPFDFSKVSYEMKSKWLLKYLTFGTLSVEIKDLSETWLTILAGENIDLNCILNENEIKQFTDENRVLIDDILSFLVSLDEIILILLNNSDNEEIEYKTDLEVIKEQPEYFECLFNIIKKYPVQIEGIRMYYLSKYEHRVYDCVIRNISNRNDIYEAVINLPYAKILGQIFGL